LELKWKGEIVEIFTYRNQLGIEQYKLSYWIDKSCFSLGIGFYMDAFGISQIHLEIGFLTFCLVLY